MSQTTGSYADQDPNARPNPRVRSLAFPWPSSLAALLLAFYLLLAGSPQAFSPTLTLPPVLQTLGAQIAALGTFALLLLLDLYRHGRAQRVFDADTDRLRQELRQVWQSKKQLQLKAHTYAGHADKLKLFISEKLLEYIEYDEKFLHFKSIAAEVRHNGVICFDKVQSALQAALEEVEAQRGADITEAAEPDHRQGLQEALDAMRYLWDLLDLSTTDNIALHISNQLCECEEHYYQRLLHPEEPPMLPHNPDFSPRRAALRALAPLLQDRLPAELEEGLDRDQPLLLDSDPQFRAYLEPTDSLLGNENHFILMLENLLKNAQFFARKKARKKHSRIALRLRQQNDQIEVSVYNRGPLIREEKIDQIFQLGYSTRRAREHHGRGLGLFFVQEIVKGYEGRISVDNLENRPAVYSLRLALADQRVMTEVIQVTLDAEGQPQCQRAKDETPQPKLEWQLDSPITQVELTPADSEQTLRLDWTQAKGRISLLDPENSLSPRWAMEFQSRRGGDELRFVPLDIEGVCFRICLPSTASRLDGEVDALEPTEPQVDDLNRPFAALEHFHDR